MNQLEDDTTTNKDLGQHWLNDAEALTSIIDFANIKPSDHVLEIGPGQGALTNLLVKQSDHVTAVEIDQALIKMLKTRFKNQPKLSVVAADIRSFDLNQLPKNYLVVANIPYYLTANLIRRLSEAENPPISCTLLVQKEVAERLSAKPGKLTLLGVTAQAYWQISTGQVIPAHLFSPPPKVDSQLVKLVRHPNPLIPASLNHDFFNLVHICFNQRRKTMANSLSSGPKLDKIQAEKMLQMASINPMSRPQDLSLNDWLKLASLLFTDKHQK